MVGAAHVRVVSLAKEIWRVRANSGTIFLIAILAFVVHSLHIKTLHSLSGIRATVERYS